MLKRPPPTAVSQVFSRATLKACPNKSCSSMIRFVSPMKAEYVGTTCDICKTVVFTKTEWDYHRVYVMRSAINDSVQNKILAQRRVTAKIEAIRKTENSDSQ